MHTVTPARERHTWFFGYDKRKRTLRFSRTMVLADAACNYDCDHSTFFYVAHYVNNSCLVGVDVRLPTTPIITSLQASPATHPHAFVV